MENTLNDHGNGNNANTVLPTVLSTKILKELHKIIDRKFNRTDRSKKVNPFLLEAKMTLWCLAEEFKYKDPSEFVELLKELVARGSVVTNIEEEGVYPFDAYFIPKTELLDKNQFKIYAHVKSVLHGG